MVHGRDAARGAETVAEIAAAGGKASFVAADLSDIADVQWMAGEVGKVDILVNNAGSRSALRVDRSTFAFLVRTCRRLGQN